jgi:hypothetical protein
MGVRYYRLKIIDNNGGFTYSPIRPVVFNDEITWQVFPNPSNGHFNFTYQAPDGEIVDIRLHDVSGRTVGKWEIKANGFVEKLAIDISGPQYPAGLYLLDIQAGDKKQTFRLIRQ